MRVPLYQKCCILAVVILAVIGGFFVMRWHLINKYEKVLKEKDKTAETIIAQLESYRYLNDSLKNLPPDIKWKDRWHKKPKPDTVKILDTLYLSDDIPEESEPVIVQDITGEIKVIYRKWGFPICYPKLSVSWTTDLSIGADIRWLYFKTFGLYSGIYYGVDETFGILTGIDWRLPYLTNATLNCGGFLNNKLDKGVAVGIGIFLR